MLKDLKFRRVKHTEVNLALARWLDRACFEYDSPFPIHEDTILWIGKADGVPVAYCTLTHLYEKTAFLSRAGVLPKYRGKGIHKRMIKLRIQAAKKLGLDTLVTYTARYNARSLNNLIGCRFRAYLPQGDWGGDEAVYLYLKLKGKESIDAPV